MRVLLAGSTGVIGRLLVSQLHDAGHEVLGISRRAGALAGTGATEIVADLDDREAVRSATAGIRADAVVHHATALKKPPATPRAMDATNRLRAEGTRTLLSVAEAIGATRFVAASIVYGYGFGDHGSAVLDEDAPFAIEDGSLTDPTQRALGVLDRSTREAGGIALRFGLYYGTGATSPVTNSARVLPWVHVADAARATVLALDHGAEGSAINIVDDTPATWAEVYRAQAGERRSMALPVPLVRLVAPFGVRLMAETELRVSNARAKRELSWEPTFPSYRAAFA